mmetsp:Transcript_36669/g.95338  ORF Transcript_36669/g.95338 Transcript_36669/m.95338 type:complete len:227 (-) Transcript_36669:2-682(-)
MDFEEYDGPMPRLVVPMELLEASASKMPSMIWWLSKRMCERVEMKTRSTARGSNSFKASNSFIKVGTWQTTPLPMRFLQPLLMMPQGNKWKAYFLPSTTNVWPAFAPPLKRAQTCASFAMMSTNFPLPSSPHCAPSTTENLQSSSWTGCGDEELASKLPPWRRWSRRPWPPISPVLLFALALFSLNVLPGDPSTLGSREKTMAAVTLKTTELHSGRRKGTGRRANA